MIKRPEPLIRQHEVQGLVFMQKSAENKAFSLEQLEL